VTGVQTCALPIWRKFDAARQRHASAALERIRSCPGLARDVAEVVGNALGAAA
jgi:aminopeptidase N